MRARWVTSTRADGDFRIDQPAAVLAERRRAFVDLPWVWVRQVHGARVVTVDAANVEAVCGIEADALVTATPGLALAVHTADCVPVVLASPAGVIGVVHAGWRGIAAGVVGAAVEAMEALGAPRDGLSVAVGPHIGPECYEFGPEELARLEAQLGASCGLRSRTLDGSPALDLRAALAAAARRAGVSGPVPTTPACTSCDADRYYSHRARAERARMATVAWLA